MYYTSAAASEKLGVTRRRINAMCQKGEIYGARKDGNHWTVPESFVNSRLYGANRTFNTAGICIPGEHYMVDISERLAEAKKLVDAGRYFTLNRARQFGKTTMLHALSSYLSRDYLVISLDFQMQMSSSKFRSENTFSLAFAKAVIAAFPATQENADALEGFKASCAGGGGDYDLVELFSAISAMCGAVSRPVVLIIDEVDSAANNQVFLDFLAQLRGYYINRDRFPAFHSVILAGVCDIRNLRRKLRPEDEHRDNSPWNIAADFGVDMSFSAEQIRQMLDEYELDRHTGMDTAAAARLIFDYTGGYPYLVSRICCLADASGRSDAWSRSGISDMVCQLLKEPDSLFDDIGKKLRDYPELRTMIYNLLFCGKSIPYNTAAELVSIGTMFGFLKEDNGQVAVANRIFETWLYNLFIATEASGSPTYDAGQNAKSQFISGGELNMRRVLEKFTEHYTEAFYGSSDKFIEDNGRKLFLLYIRPIINGTGNYYIESRTRSMGRTDLIIDYKGSQYVIEMKIWHGEEYNSRGEKQLAGYLEEYDLQTGYMVSFNFNRSKHPGVHEITIDNKTIVEAVV